MRALEWMLERSAPNRSAGTDHFFGISPSYGDMNWRGSDFSQAAFDSVMRMDKADWQAEMQLHAELFERLKLRMPEALERHRQVLSTQIEAL